MTNAAGGYDQWLEFWLLPDPQEQDSLGGPIGSPSLHFESWGKLEPLGTREFPEAQKRHQEATARFRIPYQAYSIDPAKHQIVTIFDEEASPPITNRWNILGVSPVDGKSFEHRIEVSEVK